MKVFQGVFTVDGNVCGCNMPRERKVKGVPRRVFTVWGSMTRGQVSAWWTEAGPGWRCMSRKMTGSNS